MSSSPTGRLTRGEPALQNLPVRTPEGAQIREAFMKKKRIDWSLSGCCGAPVRPVAGIRRCSACGREVADQRYHQGAAPGRREQLDREYETERGPDPSTRGRLDHPLR